MPASPSPFWSVNPPTAPFPQAGPPGQVLLAMPQALDLSRAVETVVFFHGQRTDIAKKLEASYKIVSQVAASGRNAVVVAPQLRFLQSGPGANDPGQIAKSGALKLLLDDVALVFEARAGQPGLAAKLREGPVILSSFSGGYITLAAALSVGQLGKRVSAVAMFDSAYGHFDPLALGFASIAPPDKRKAVFVSWHGETTPDEIDPLGSALATRGIKVTRGKSLPVALNPGEAYLLDVRATKHEQVPPDGPPTSPLTALLSRLPSQQAVPLAAPAAAPTVAPVYTIDTAHNLAGPNVLARITKAKRSGLTRKFIVLHYTAGGSALASAKFLETIGLSAHVIVDRDGSIIQTVPFDHVAYHAGASEWEGYVDLNEWAIGIEISNYGWLTPRPDGSFQRVKADGSAETPRFEASQVLVADHPNGSPRAHGWELYPEAQRTSVRALCETLLKTYPEIIDIVGHDEIAPGRKQDPGPALDMAPFRHLVEARNVDRGPRYEVMARDGANLRAGPGTQFKVLRLLPERQTLFGKSKSTEWLSVDLQGDGMIDGFVHLSLLRRVQ